jgi:uncharacterized membrane protein YqaE (UPF0057 family)
MLAVLAVLCPPATVALIGRPSQVFANIGLTLCLFVPGVVHAFGVLQTQRVRLRNETLMNIAARYYA